MIQGMPVSLSAPIRTADWREDEIRDGRHRNNSPHHHMDGIPRGLLNTAFAEEIRKELPLDWQLQIEGLFGEVRAINVDLHTIQQKTVEREVVLPHTVTKSGNLSKQIRRLNNMGMAQRRRMMLARANQARVSFRRSNSRNPRATKKSVRRNYITFELHTYRRYGTPLLWWKLNAVN